MKRHLVLATLAGLFASLVLVSEAGACCHKRRCPDRLLRPLPSAASAASAASATSAATSTAASAGVPAEEVLPVQGRPVQVPPEASLRPGGLFPDILLRPGPLPDAVLRWRPVRFGSGPGIVPGSLTRFERPETRVVVRPWQRSSIAPEVGGDPPPVSPHPVLRRARPLPDIVVVAGPEPSSTYKKPVDSLRLSVPHGAGLAREPRLGSGCGVLTTQPWSLYRGRGAGRRLAPPC